jgi:hypothetical protein
MGRANSDLFKTKQKKEGTMGEWENGRIERKRG